MSSKSLEEVNKTLSNGLCFLSYINNKTKTTIKCVKCGFCWEIIPKNVTIKTVCKKCKYEEIPTFTLGIQTNIDLLKSENQQREPKEIKTITILNKREDNGLYKQKCTNIDCGEHFYSVKKVCNRCTICFFSEPKKSVKDDRKKYELEVESFLNLNNYNFSCGEAISIAKKHNLYPDFIFYQKSHFILLEVDENCHKNYEDEINRQILITRELNKNTYFIRFNPGSFLPIEKERLLVLKEILDDLLTTKYITEKLEITSIKLFYFYQGRNKVVDNYILDEENIVHKFNLPDKTLEDALEMLPVGITFSEYNGYRKNSYLLCMRCGFSGESWNIIPKYSNKNIICHVCDIEQNIVPTLDHNNILPSYILNKKLPNNICFLSYTNNKTKATVKCTICDYIWSIVPKNITERTFCRKCSRVEKHRYHKSEFEKILDNNKLYINDFSSENIPLKNDDIFECVCNVCGRTLNLNINEINNGLICLYCEEVKPRLNRSRCIFFSSKYIDYVTLTCEIINPKDPEEVDVSRYKWTCLNGDHSTFLTLSTIKRYFDKYGENNWCFMCREKNNTKKKRFKIKTSGDSE